MLRLWAKCWKERNDMLKILRRGETPDAELVRREANSANVTDTVAAIIADGR